MTLLRCFSWPTLQSVSTQRSLFAEDICRENEKDCTVLFIWFFMIYNFPDFFRLEIYDQFSWWVLLQWHQKTQLPYSLTFKPRRNTQVRHSGCGVKPNFYLIQLRRKTEGGVNRGRPKSEGIRYFIVMHSVQFMWKHPTHTHSTT